MLNRSQFKHFLMESGLCIDRVRLLDWIVKKPLLKTIFFRFLRLRFSPGILKNARSQNETDKERGRLFSLAISYLNVGDTYKTTGKKRTNAADDLLVKLAKEFENPSLLDVGSSDGSSSISLIESDAFNKIRLTDQCNFFYEKDFLLGKFFLNAHGAFLGVKFLFLYFNLALNFRLNTKKYTLIQTLNPLLESHKSIHGIEHLDIFDTKCEEKFDLIKCSNVLNRSYFSDDLIIDAVNNLSKMLNSGGYLLISQNNESYKDGEAFFVLKKSTAGLHVEFSSNHHDIEHLFTDDKKSSPKELKVMLLAPSLETGGAERQLVELANGISKYNIEVALVLFNNKGALLSRLHPSIHIHDLNKKGYFDFVFLAWRLRNLIIKERVDILYSFLGVPNILSCIMKISGVAPRVACSIRASNMDYSKYRLKSRICEIIERRLSHVPDLTISNSQAGKDYAITNGFNYRDIAVVHNGIDVSYFFPDRKAGNKLRNKWCNEDNIVMVGIVARLDPMKDHKTFLRAASMVAKVNSRARFVCVGTGPLEFELREFSEELGLTDILTWAGEQKNMHWVYNAIDVCCLSSLFGEGFPNVLGEAMACDIPCVSTDVGDASLIINNHHRIVEAGNHKALCNSILKIIDKIDSKQRFNLRPTIVDRFSTDAMVRQTVQRLKQVI